MSPPTSPAPSLPLLLYSSNISSHTPLCPSGARASAAVQATYSSLVDCSSAAELRDTIGEGRLPERPRERPTVRERTREEDARLRDEMTRRLRRTIDSCGAAATAPMAAATRAAGGGYEAAAASLVFARETLDSASALQRLPARLCDAAEAAEAKGDLGLASWARDTRASSAWCLPGGGTISFSPCFFSFPRQHCRGPPRRRCWWRSSACSCRCQRSRSRDAPPRWVRSSPPTRRWSAATSLRRASLAPSASARGSRRGGSMQASRRRRATRRCSDSSMLSAAHHRSTSSWNRLMSGGVRRVALLRVEC